MRSIAQPPLDDPPVDAEPELESLAASSLELDETLVSEPLETSSPEPVVLPVVPSSVAVPPVGAR